MQLWSGKTAGTTTIGSGTCAGTTVGIAKARVLTTRTADANGNLAFRLNLKEAACSRLFQAVDLATCATSNVIGAP